MIESAKRLIAKMPTIAAWAYKKSVGQPYIYPRNDLSYVDELPPHDVCAPGRGRWRSIRSSSRALNVLLILHADHGQNCSTATVRFVGSSQANLFASRRGRDERTVGTAPRRRQPGGGRDAPGHPRRSGRDGRDRIARASQGSATTPFRLMGFGHRVYKNYDPRARILKQLRRGRPQPGRRRTTRCSRSPRSSRRRHWQDDYFVSRNLYPNVDFYSGHHLPGARLPARACSRCCSPSDACPVGSPTGKRCTRTRRPASARPRQIYVGHDRARRSSPIDQRQLDSQVTTRTSAHVNSDVSQLAFGTARRTARRPRRDAVDLAPGLVAIGGSSQLNTSTFHTGRDRQP